MDIRWRPATALLILAVAVAACGGTSSAPSPVAQAQASAPAASSAPAGAPAGATSGAPVGAEACALITESEAEAFLGSDPGPGNDTGTAGSPACAYGASLTLGVETEDAKALYDSRKAAMEGSGKAQALDGVGDAGFVFIVGDTIAQMAILKGSSLLTVNVQGDPSLQNVTLARLTELGATAVSRL